MKTAGATIRKTVRGRSLTELLAGTKLVRAVPASRSNLKAAPPLGPLNSSSAQAATKAAGGRNQKPYSWTGHKPSWGLLDLAPIPLGQIHF
jgi:hypothetical protein